MGKTFKDMKGKGRNSSHRRQDDEHVGSEHHYEHAAPVRVQPSFQGKRPAPAKSRPDNNTKMLATASFNGDGKIFYLDAIENERGKALRIAEVSKGKRTIILIPASLLVEYENQMGKVTPVLVQA